MISVVQMVMMKASPIPTPTRVAMMPGSELIATGATPQIE
jgi:hypothetical protein